MKKETKKKVVKKKTAIVVQKNNIEVMEIPEAKRQLLQQLTPREFIKVRPGKGRQQFRYVSVGYVIATLNKCFTPFGWDFDILEKEIFDLEKPGDTEIVVKGKLIVKSVGGYQTFKVQYGCHSREKGHTGKFGMTVGDAIKSASSDSLKKCASYYGIGLDVYWDEVEKVILDHSKETKKAMKEMTGKKVENEKEVYFKIAISGIAKEENFQVLQKWKDSLPSSEKYTDAMKNDLLKMIDDKLFADES